jgi:hypothetical protein
MLQPCFLASLLDANILIADPRAPNPEEVVRRVVARSALVILGKLRRSGLTIHGRVRRRQPHSQN